MRFHIHWYKLVEYEPEANWGGLTVRRWVRMCRICKARKVSVSGYLKP